MTRMPTLLFLLTAVSFIVCCRSMETTPPAAGPPARPTEPQLMYSMMAAETETTSDIHVSGPFNTEEYDRIFENPFMEPSAEPLSTFSVDVDTASYANARRFLNDDRLPPADAVRIEEFINYFHYDYDPPSADDDHPFTVTTELAACPWRPEHRLLHIGLQTASIESEALPPSNVVFLLDVSGSMNVPNKLPLLKRAFSLLTQELRAEDQVAIVVYAGAAGTVLPSTSGKQKTRILEALEQLSAGGSTAGGEGLRLAYDIAERSFNPDGNNRVILATDGDFNIGPSSDAEMVRLIEDKRESGIFLTVLGFGDGNYKDAKMEKLADHGNGNYAYIDNILEARKVLISELGATLVTVAKDVKLQLEFNPVAVAAYRLIGYENRTLRARDFDDDTKDAGEMGAGHSVTALYQIVPAGVAFEGTDRELRYQTREPTSRAIQAGELVTVSIRYKAPNENVSRLLANVVRTSDLVEDGSDRFAFSAAVAGFGMLLRDSQYRGNMTFAGVVEMAQGAQGEDSEGYRSEFIRLVKSAGLLAETETSPE